MTRRRTADTVAILVSVRCHDKRAVIEAARDNARAQGIKSPPIRDWRDAVQWLIDPGAIPGCTVLESSSESSKL